MNNTATTQEDTEASNYNHRRDDDDTRFQAPKRDDFDEDERDHTEVSSAKDTETNDDDKASDDISVNRDTPNSDFFDEPIRDENTMTHYDTAESNRFNETTAPESDSHSKAKESEGDDDNTVARYDNEGDNRTDKTDQVLDDTVNHTDYEAAERTRFDEPDQDKPNTVNDTKEHDNTTDRSEKRDEYDRVWEEEPKRDNASGDDKAYTERFVYRDERETLKDTSDHFINDNDHEERTVRYDDATERFDHREVPETLKDTKERDHFINDNDHEELTVRYDEATERLGHLDEPETLKDTKQHDSFINDKDTDKRMEPRKATELRNFFEASDQPDNQGNSNERDHFDEKVRDEAEVRNEEDSHDNLANNSPGTILRQERERQKMSVKYVADKLYLDMRVIESLEVDNYEELPPTIFVRGYLRNYARLLEMEPSLIINSYDRLQQEPLPIYPEPQSKPKKQARSRDIWPITAIVVIALMILAVLWQFYPKNPETTTIASPTEPRNDQPDESTWTPTFSPTETEEPVIPTEMDETNPNQRTETPSVEPKTPLTADNSTENTEVPIGEESETPVNLSHNMRVRFKDRAWIRITDSSGNRLYQGTGNAGEILPLEGTPPFSLMVGNFEGVDIEYNGEINKVADYPKQRGQKNLYIVGGEE